MIKVNVNDRITARQAMDHEWIKNADALARANTMDENEQQLIN
jgi:hypothetical protein